MTAMEQIKENLKSFFEDKKLRDYSELLETEKQERKTFQWQHILSEEEPPIVFNQISLVVHREIVSERRFIFVKIQTTNLPINFDVSGCVNLLLQYLQINNETVCFFAFDKIKETEEQFYEMNILFLCVTNC